MNDLEKKAIGCMVASAYGDCLGSSVEFLTTDEIREDYGYQGISIPEPCFDFPFPVITDDTQMAIATAKGLISVKVGHSRLFLNSIWKAYTEWFYTQDDPEQRRAPGNTCIKALAGRVPGSISTPLNKSGGCGGVMRSHPIGIFFRNDPLQAFSIGIKSAALTHGAMEAFLPAGLLAYLIANILKENSFTKALDLMVTKIEKIPSNPGSASVKKAISEALEVNPVDDNLMGLIDNKVGQVGKAGFNGGGWMGHDALAIALFAAKNFMNDPVLAVKVAVNHSGDSDSTGCIAGAIMGAIYGPEPFEKELFTHSIKLERHKELEELALSLLNISK